MMERTESLPLHLKGHRPGAAPGLLIQHGAGRVRRECFSNEWIRHFPGGGSRDGVPGVERGDVIFPQSINPLPSIKI